MVLEIGLPACSPQGTACGSRTQKSRSRNTAGCSGPRTGTSAGPGQAANINIFHSTGNIFSGGKYFSDGQNVYL